MFIKKLFPNGFRSLAGFLLLVLVTGMAEPLLGAISVQAETVTLEQMAALQEQEAAALKVKEEAERIRQFEAAKAAFKESGTTFDLNTVPESTLALARDVKAATPLDLRSSLAVAVYARKFNIRPSLLVAVISKESNFHQFSVGSNRDRGYMQIIPPTERFMARYYGGTLGLSYDPKRIFDPEYNLGLGAAYLAGMQGQYRDVNRILTEYNRGQGRTENYFSSNGSYSTSYSRKVLEIEQQYSGLK